jgi:4-amino-4-deoxy-L-arabinose transferase-like glycosyltransferase
MSPQLRLPAGVSPRAAWCESRFTRLACLVLLLAAFNLTFRLGHEVVTEWDESLYATSAWEMVESGDWLVPTFHGAVDYYNSKPPLNIWLIAASFKAFGHGLLALRLASAAAAWLTVFVLMRWTRKEFGAPAALMSGLILATTFGFVYVHAGRSGNPDAVLTLLVTLTAVLCADARSNPRLRIWLGPVAAGVFMLKGMAVLLPLAMVAAAEVTVLRHGPTRWRHLAWAAVGFAVLVLPWVVARWTVDGWAFFRQMVGYDFIARAIEPIEEHPGSPVFYLNILQRYAYEWLGTAAVVILLRWRRLLKGPDRPSTASRGTWTLMAIWAGFTLLVPTAMQTKLPWYLNPFYPVFAATVGYLVSNAVLASAVPGLNRRAQLAAAVALLIAFGLAEGRLIHYSYTYRDISRSPQGILLAESATIAGRRVYGVNWTRADWFVASAIAGAGPVHVAEVGALWMASQPGDYILSRAAIDDTRLAKVRSNRRATLYRRVY